MVKVLRDDEARIKLKDDYKELVEITLEELNDLENLALGGLSPKTIGINIHEKGSNNEPYSVAAVSLGLNTVILNKKKYYDRMHGLAKAYEKATLKEWTLDIRDAD